MGAPGAHPPEPVQRCGLDRVQPVPPGAGYDRHLRRAGRTGAPAAGRRRTAREPDARLGRPGRERIADGLRRLLRARRARRSRDDPKNGADEIARGFTPRILARALSSLAPARSFLVTRPLPPPARSPHFLLDPRTPRYDSACRTRHGATTRSWGDH